MRIVPLIALCASSLLLTASPQRVTASCTEAEVLVLELTQALSPPDSLTAHVNADLVAIRTFDPFFERIHVSPDWDPSALLIELTPEAMQEFLAGTYHGLDELNAQYGPVEMRPLTFGNWIKVTLSQCYSPPQLAILYGGAQGVVFSGPDYNIGDGSDIGIQGLGLYTFRLAWGDCPSGCIYEHFWVFRVEGASVELLEDYGDQVAVRETSWGEIKARFLGSK